MSKTEAERDKNEGLIVSSLEQSEPEYREETDSLEYLGTEVLNSYEVEYYIVKHDNPHIVAYTDEFYYIEGYSDLTHATFYQDNVVGVDTGHLKNWEQTLWGKYLDARWQMEQTIQEYLDIEKERINRLQHE